MESAKSPTHCASSFYTAVGGNQSFPPVRVPGIAGTTGKCPNPPLSRRPSVSRSIRTPVSYVTASSSQKLEGALRNLLRLTVRGFPCEPNAPTSKIRPRPDLRPKGHRNYRAGRRSPASGLLHGTPITPVIFDSGERGRRSYAAENR